MFQTDLTNVYGYTLRGEKKLLLYRQILFIFIFFFLYLLYYINIRTEKEFPLLGRFCPRLFRFRIRFSFRSKTKRFLTE